MGRCMIFEQDVMKALECSKICGCMTKSIIPCICMEGKVAVFECFDVSSAVFADVSQLALRCN